MLRDEDDEEDVVERVTPGVGDHVLGSKGDEDAASAAHFDPLGIELDHTLARRDVIDLVLVVVRVSRDRLARPYPRRG